MATSVGSLTVFEHSSQDWDIFKSRLVQYIKLNAVIEDNKCALLLTHLSDDTYRLVRNLLHPKKVEDAKFDELVLVLDKQFTPKRCIFVDRAKFYEATRDVTESVEDWAARVRGLAVYCEFGASLDELLRDRFVLGLKVGPERDRLFEQDAATLTFAKAVEVAQQAACARSARALPVPAAVVHVKQEQVYRVGTTHSDADGAEGARRCSVCGMKSHDAIKCRYKNYRCQACGQKGHLKKVCNAQKTKCRVHNMEAEPATSCEECKECELFNIRYVHYAPILLDVCVDDNSMQMELDSGSGSTVLSKKLYNEMFSDTKLKKCDLKMCLYNGHQITPLGYFTAKVSYLQQTHDINIYVMENGGPIGLLGRDFMTKFKLSFTVDNYFVCTESSQNQLSQLLSEHSSLFAGDLGKFNKYQVELKLKENAKPKFFKPRPVPFALKERVEEEIDRLVSLGILVPVNFSKYATPIVPVLKDNGKIKIAGDFSVTLNKDMVIDKYPMPRIEEVFAKIGGGRCYTKLDLSNAYNQFVLSDTSQELTTINTTKGLYKYTRLLYGLANGPAICQRAMETLLAGIDGVSCWLDDVCVTGPTDEVHLLRLREVLKRLQDAGLKLQKEKCDFFKSSVTYLGYVIDKNGLRTSPKKLEAILNAPSPTNVLEIKRFLGIVNYYRSFVPNASGMLSPLHELLRDGAKWEWGIRQQKAFESVKRELCSERVLAHFDPAAQLVLSVDAGPGLGAVLSQRDHRSGVERPLAFASRSLTRSERNYSQIQKEATAIVFGVKRFHQYLYGRQDPFILKTDHRPLLSIFGNKVGISVMAASRLQRYAIILSAYNYDVQYISSSKNVVADYFSRAPLPESDDKEEDDDKSFLKFLDANVAPVTFEDLKKATESDSVLQTVIKYMNHGWPRKITCASILPYFNCKADLEVDSGCLFRGHRVVIPTLYRKQMLQDLHSGHLGIVKTKSIARSKLWWPKVDHDIEQWIGSCSVCVATRPSPPRAAPAPWPRPPAAWHRIHIDYMSFEQRVYLIVIDAYSKWLECLFMKGGTSTRSLISELKELFSRFGVPHVIVSDNDVKIKSDEFQHFCSINGIRYLTSPVYHAASNGQAENSVRTCKKMLKCIINTANSHKDVNDKLLGYLFEYRNTPHCSTKLSPAQIMFGRNLRSRLDMIRRQTKNNNDYKENHFCRQFQKGDKIWLRWFTARKQFWTLGIIRNVIGNRMFEIYVNDYDILCKRHVDQIMKYKGSEELEKRLNDGEDDVTNTWIPPPSPAPSSPPSPSPPLLPNPPLFPSTVEEHSNCGNVVNDECNTDMVVEEEVENVEHGSSEAAPVIEPTTAPAANSAHAPPLRVGPTLRPRTKKIDYRNLSK